MGSPASAHPRRQHRTSILRRAIRQFLLMATAIVVILSGTSFLVARRLLTERVLSQVSLTASSAEDFLEEYLRSARERGALLASLDEVRRIVNGDASDAELQDWAQRFRTTQVGLRGITIFAADGHRITGTGTTMGFRKTSATEIVADVTPMEGWRSYDVLSPVHSAQGMLIGYVTLRYEAPQLPTSLDSSLFSLSQSAQLVVGVRTAQQIFLLQYVAGDTPWVPASNTAAESLLLRALQGEEGVVRTVDTQGEGWLIAYREIPSLGWGVAVPVPEQAALSGVRRLSVTLGAIGLGLLIMAALLAILLARELATPLLQLTEKVRQLRPGQWTFRQSVHSRDEVQLLDEAFASMAARLQQTYEHLEEEVQARTVELRHQYALDRAVLEGIDYGVFTVAPDGKISSANPAAQRVLGMTADQLVGAVATAALPLCEGADCIPLREHPIDLCERTRTPQRPDPRRQMSLLQGDHPLPVDVLVSPLIAEGTWLGSVVLFADVSEERRIDAMKSEFISLASHQLRTPISIVRWQLDLIGTEGKISKTQKEALTEATSAVERMTDLLNALLQVARLEGGEVPVDFHETDVRAVIADVLKDMHLLAERRGTRLSVAKGTAQRIAWTDPSMLSVVLQNLVVNGLKYNRKGGHVRISTSSKGNRLRITVTDDGVGIPVGEQERIFEKFFRATNIRQFDTDGNGLGLYMCHLIMGALRGSIRFSSEEGKGTTFVIDVPRLQKKASKKRRKKAT